MRFTLLVFACAFASTGCSFFSEANSDAAKQEAQIDFRTLTADEWLNLSQDYHQQGRYLEAIGAAQSALYLRPGYAEAYNNIGAAYASLGMWDPAIQAAQQAIQLKADFQLAKNNLAWAVQQKQLAAGMK